MLDRLTEYFFPKQVSTFASDIDNLYFFIFYSSVALFLIVVFGMLYLSIKYRHRKGEDLKLTIYVEDKYKYLFQISVKELHWF